MNPITGGVSQALRNSIPEWDKHGHQSQVLCFDDPDSEFFKNENLSIISLGPAKSSWQYASKLMPWLMSNLSNYDVVIVEGIWQYHSFAVSKAIRKLRLSNAKCPKFFIMPHGMLDPYFQKAESRKLKAIRNEIYWRLIESKNIKQADAVLFTCEEELLLARQTFKGYQPQKEINVGFGIPAVPAYTNAMKESFLAISHLAQNEKYFLFLSRIHPKKGADILIDVYGQWIKNSTSPIDQLPSLIVAGPGLETDYGQKLLDSVAAYGLNSKIVFTGMLSKDSKWGAFYGSEAYVLCSHQENFGISVVESLACAKPVIISDQINIWREIDHEGAGIICKDDAESLKLAFQKWFDLSNEQKKQMNENAAKTYLKYFHVAAATQKMIDSIR